MHKRNQRMSGRGAVNRYTKGGLVLANARLFNEELLPVTPSIQSCAARTLFHVRGRRLLDAAATEHRARVRIVVATRDEGEQLRYRRQIDIGRCAYRGIVDACRHI